MFLKKIIKSKPITVSVSAVLMVLLVGVCSAFATDPTTIDFSNAIDWSAIATVISGLVVAAVGGAAVLFGGFQGLKAAMSAFVSVVSKSFGR